MMMIPTMIMTKRTLRHPLLNVLVFRHNDYSLKNKFDMHSLSIVICILREVKQMSGRYDEQANILTPRDGGGPGNTAASTWDPNSAPKKGSLTGFIKNPGSLIGGSLYISLRMLVLASLTAAASLALWESLYSQHEIPGYFYTAHTWFWLAIGGLSASALWLLSTRNINGIGFYASFICTLCYVGSATMFGVLDHEAPPTNTFQFMRRFTWGLTFIYMAFAVVALFFCCTIIAAHGGIKAALLNPKSVMMAVFGRPKDGNVPRGNNKGQLCINVDQDPSSPDKLVLHQAQAGPLGCPTCVINKNNSNDRNMPILPGSVRYPGAVEQRVLYCSPEHRAADSIRHKYVFTQNAYEDIEAESRRFNGCY
jgi:hypothetical protein